MGASKNGISYSFTYNQDGIRTSKTVDGITTEYFLDGTQIIGERTGDNITVYIYDASGAPIGMKYHGASYAEDTWDIYWFEKNIQGDIVAVYDEVGTKLLSYTYDAWGNFSTSYYNLAISPSVINNPFTYRGYYYDRGLGMYYLQSRYYDSNIGRFINVDSALYHNMLGYNMYAYCYNNPVNYVDYTGESASAAFGGWLASLWWLGGVDGPLPIGDIIFLGGTAILGIIALVEAANNSNDKSSSKDKASDKPAPPQSITEPNDSSSSSDKNNLDKDSRLRGEPGEIKIEGNKEAHIGANRRAYKERHHTDHGNSKKHTNPHDHYITWDSNDNPIFSDPQNYWDGNIPIFP